MEGLKTPTVEQQSQIRTRLDVARQCMRRGWMPVPVRAGSKVPAVGNWPKFRAKMSELEQHFSGEGNIGVLTGKPSLWLVDVNLECEEAIALAQSVLPRTLAVTGHERRPNSHHWFISRDAPSFTFRDPVTREVIVELRSTGQLSLIGPSTHPGGGNYDLLTQEPAEVPWGLLGNAVGRIAEAVCRMRGRSFDGPLEGLDEQAHETTDGQALPDLSRWSIAERVDRARLHLDALPPAISGQNGHNATFQAACAVAWGFAVPQDAAMELMRDHYNTRCEPAWSPFELKQKVEDAYTTRHTKPRGWMLETTDA